MKLHQKNYLYDPLVGNFLSWLIGFAIMMPYINEWVTTPVWILIGMFVAPIWTIWLHAYRQAIQIEIKKKEINHTTTSIVRVIIALVIAFLSHLLITCVCVDMILPALACSFYLGSIFWLFFDFFINHHRGKPWDYRSKEENAANSDKIFRERKIWWITSKLVIFLFALLLYYRALINV